MGFSSLNFRDRFFRLGDEAEDVFEKYADKHDISYQRYGFNRPPLSKFRYLDEFVRNTPDYVAQWNKKLFFVECKGTAYNHVKIKPDQFDVLGSWDSYEPVIVFIYNSRTKGVSFMSLEEIRTASQGLPVKTFSSDNREYWEIPIIWDRDIAQVV